MSGPTFTTNANPYWSCSKRSQLPNGTSPSLCAEWRVRDVVGHMVSQTRMTVTQAAWGFVTSGFRNNRYIVKDARQRGAARAGTLSRIS